MQSLLIRYRVSLGVFILGLIISGLTAFPLLSELQLLSGQLGISDPAKYPEYTGLKYWIAFVHHGLKETYRSFPYIAYGTDWLAFGHLSIAVFFIRPFFRPMESGWVLKCGLICCAGVIPLAMIAGQIRGIPFYWRLVDCSFGVFGAIPLWYCLRLGQQMRLMELERATPGLGGHLK